MIDFGTRDGMGACYKSVVTGPGSVCLYFEPVYHVDGLKFQGNKHYIGYLMDKYTGTEHEAEMLAHVLGIDL